MMKRVLHLGAGNLYGGIETLLVTLATERSACPRMTPEFGLCFDGRLSSELRDTGVSVSLFGKVRFSRPWSLWLARRRLRRLLAENPPDVVVTHACWPHAVFGPVVRDASIPLLFWAHDTAHPEHWLDRKASRIPPDLVLANSAYTATSQRQTFDGIPMQTFYYPVRSPANFVAARRDSLRKELETLENAVVVLMACRMENWKGHRLILEGLGSIKENTHWVCWIAGGAQRPHEQEYFEQLRALEAKLGLAGRIRWLGQRSDIPELMAAADIYCQPNLRPEPFGIVFVEALYASLPVIAIREGGAAEIVDDSCGILVDPERADLLAGAISSLVEDRPSRLRLSANAPPRARLLCDPSRQLGRLLFEVEAVTKASGA